MKRLWVFPVFILWGVFSTSAQSLYNIEGSSEFFNNNKLGQSQTKMRSASFEYEGSPYLEEDFTEGSVYTKSKKQYVEVPLRYNIYTGEVEFRSGDGPVQALAAPRSVEKIAFGEYHLEFVPFQDRNKVERAFFVVAEKGRATLYRRPRVRLQEAKEPAAYQDAQPAKFSRQSDDFFIRVGTKPAKPVEKKKHLVEVFPDHKKELETFIKENNVKPKRAETLEELVKYYNSL